MDLLIFLALCYYLISKLTAPKKKPKHRKRRSSWWSSQEHYDYEQFLRINGK